MTNYLPLVLVLAPLATLVALVYIASQPSKKLAGNTNIDLGLDIDTSDLNLRSILGGGL